MARWGFIQAVSRRLRAGQTALRLTDQVLWSGSFFFFTAATANVLSTRELSQVAIVSAVALIAAAIGRTFAVDSRAVSGATHGLRTVEALALQQIVLGSGIAAAAVAAGTSVFLLFGDASVSSAVMLSMLAVLLVVADTPHQALLYLKRYGRACSASAVYMLVCAVAMLSMTVTVVSSETLLVTWMLGLAGSALVSWGDLVRPSNRLRFRGPPLPRGRRSLLMSLEALYVGIAGQFALLTLYFLHDESAVVGLRLSYALFFAPVYFVVQAVAPLLIVRYLDAVARRDPAAARELRPLRQLLVVGTSLAFLLSCVVVSGAPGHTNLEVTKPFLLPSAVSLLSVQWLETSMIQRRPMLPPTALHTIRLRVIAVDVLFQLLGLVALQTSGLIAGILLGSAFRIHQSHRLTHSNRIPKLGTRLPD